MMKRYLFAVGLFMITPYCFAQNDAYIAEMEHVLAIEDTAQTAATVMAVAHQLEQITLKYDKEWLAPYWAAFVYTQVGLYTGQDERLDAYIGLAQAYYDKAKDLWDEKEEKPKSELADFYALQAFIFSWRMSVVMDNAAEYAQADLIYQAYLTKTEEANPDNPMLGMMRGLPLMAEKETREEGIRIALDARQKYATRLSSIHPNWGVNIIKYWLQYYAPEKL